MTTEEGNKILMEFLGINEDTAWMIATATIIDFDNDWDLLMQVVDKVESLDGGHHGRFVVYISSNTCSIQGTNLHKCLEPNSNYPSVYMSDPNAIFPTKIESTWYNLIKFVQWYEVAFSDYYKMYGGKQYFYL